MPHHILRDRHIMVDLPVIHLELQSYEIRQDGRAACLCFNRWRALAWSRANDIQATQLDLVRKCYECLRRVVVGEAVSDRSLRDDVGSWFAVSEDSVGREKYNYPSRPIALVALVLDALWWEVVGAAGLR